MVPSDRYRRAVLSKLHWAKGNPGGVPSDMCLRSAARLMVQGYLRSKGIYVESDLL